MAEKGAASRLPAVKENEHNDNDDDCCFNLGNDSKDRTCLNTTSDLTYLGAAKEAALAADENINLNNISNTTNVSYCNTTSQREVLSIPASVQHDILNAVTALLAHYLVYLTVLRSTGT